ncbi:hypothetical protein NOVOSPHI9U_390003 [Novosphingobium sp. 9U]|nr:hypothetical protein NOVOSPHI9U_390003 [Novosphingobium sp. 9U]
MALRVQQTLTGAALPTSFVGDPWRCARYVIMRHVRGTMAVWTPHLLAVVLPTVRERHRLPHLVDPHLDVRHGCSVVVLFPR